MIQREQISELVKQFCRPIQPIPSNEPKSLVRLKDIRGVVLDVYGTLLVSDSGEFSNQTSERELAAFETACHFAKVEIEPGDESGVEIFKKGINCLRELRLTQGTSFPEIDIIDAWDWAFSQFALKGRLAAQSSEINLPLFSLVYELQQNPCWAMPEARTLLEKLQERGLVVAIVSNAQFYTRGILEELLARSLDELGIEPRRQFWSFEHGHAKPSDFLFLAAIEEFAKSGIQASQLIFVGNDMLHDLLPANRLGLRTALFAGDARSLRKRKEDLRVGSLKPDLVLEALTDLLECL